MSNIKLDYDKLLDDWGDSLLAKADSYLKQADEHEAGSFKHGYYRGKHDGLMNALVDLHILEHRKNDKYKINEEYTFTYDSNSDGKLPKFSLDCGTKGN
jgi:hypothetical protein